MFLYINVVELIE